MAANTGPDVNTYQIPEVALGDTFNTWRDITNTAVYKLNNIRSYAGLSSSSITVNQAVGGTFSSELADNVNKGVTFLQPVIFNADVTFNAGTVTMNTNILTIDDYNIVIGDTAQASDDQISTFGGGGLLLNRGGGKTAEWLWQPTQVQGVTGVWRANSHIGFSGATSGIYPAGGGILPVHGTGIRIDGGLTSEHGLQIGLTGSGLTADRVLQFTRYSPAGSTAFMDVLSGSTYGTQPVVSIYGGVNKKIVTQAHSFAFGQPVYLNGSSYTAAQANAQGTSEVVGLVSRVIDSNNFELTFIGEIYGNWTSATEDNSTTLTPGAVYYLSPFVGGRITASLPIAAGQIHKAVLIATGTNSAIVYPFTGGILSQPTNISSATSMGTSVSQLNQFSVGDFVRWKAGIATLTYGATAGTYPLGVYVKSQANSDTESELAGMVIKTGTVVGAVSGSNIYSGFDLLMDGFFGGLCLPAYYGSISNGTVYFLKRDAAGTSNSFESSTPCYSSNYPVIAGSVRKPLFMATNSDAANFSGYLFSYRGDSIDPVGLSASIALDSLLIQNLGSCGSVQDLKFGVRDGAGTAGGKQVMRFPAARPGSVDIGWSGVGDAGATLDVKGPIRAGSASSVNSSDIIVSRYNSDVYPETLNVFGTQYSTGNSVISHGVRPAGNGTTYERYTSTSGSPAAYKTALEVGNTGGLPGLILRTSISSSAVNTGTEVPMQNTFWVNPTRMVYTGTGFGIGTTLPSEKLHVYGGSLRAERTDNGTSAILAGPSSNLQIKHYTGNPNVTLYNSSGQGFVFSTLYPSETERVRITGDGYVGIGTATPKGLLTVYANPYTTMGGITGSLANSGIVIESLLNGTDAPGPIYGPGVFWKSTANDTIPYAGIFIGGQGAGTSINFGTSSVYAQGINSVPMTIVNGKVGIGTTGPSTALLDVNGSVRAKDGILFGANTSAANTLKYYEEGTYTSTIVYSGTTTDTAPATADKSVTAKYTRIGNTVTVWIPTITKTTLGLAATGTAVISTLTLPFTAAAGAVGSARGYRLAGRYGSGLSSQSTDEYLICLVGAGNNVLYVRFEARGGSYYPTILPEYSDSELTVLTITYSV